MLPLLVLVTLASIAALYVRGDLNPILCDGPCAPQYVTPPEGLATQSPDPDEAATVGSGPIDAGALATAVAGPLQSEALGGRTSLVAVDARDGAVLIDDAEGAQIPASTTKLLTAVAVLQEWGPDARFETTVVRDGQRLVLVGGGDPYLTDTKSKGSSVERADLATLAAATAKQVGRGPVTLGYDVSLFVGPAVSPAWEEGYVGGVVAPVSPLWVDRGRVGAGRSTDPAADAARRFAELLQARGVDVTGTPTQTEASGTTIATVRSAPLSRIVEQFLADSDNEVAEVLLRQAAIKAGEPGSFAGGAEVVAQVLADAGVDMAGLVINDGSGLSRKNRISARTLAETMAEVSETPRLGSILSGLPVGGFSGTLEDRYVQSGQARGLVRAKTGTLTGVHALAGVVTLSGGRPVAFALMSDDTEGVNPFVTQAALDRVVAAMADCACGA
ncbi:D-alanyl-D-alanine carboxypeptidase/D-alanyl-D-alanine-endopeptidase [Aeromicrobium senzhongii]|uniref:D-alanyl-D-alanine carboxypeptidase/D-alanyl-D-alanine-endopeptidase n=1 Tax=Aeromicrobium senzhongii TaxID=2663859 RepID=A0ABX6SRS0_9ACTN|nr:D-alanyl-D-alanine carboxypeptidase/D-alanyl-D-alanine-endopeptidase [Aeromicrobium senzhongii]MTB88593.1 D-alanyl-D-alanine carboxypeptidase/D-alanyl-D-alanine-endopeptidase [Aeromicrobium senzhongii]QNL94096.1 D-alanyl-D-alanine carboxypeptidase/D-alanyl-D-alanine-endopeptidase [Aeromicrobium senzhongii]